MNQKRFIKCKILKFVAAAILLLFLVSRRPHRLITSNVTCAKRPGVADEELRRWFMQKMVQTKKKIMCFPCAKCISEKCYFFLQH